MEGIQRIEVTDAGITVIYDPTTVSLETVANAFYLQGLEVQP